MMRVARSASTDVTWRVGMRELEEVGSEEIVPLRSARSTELPPAAVLLGPAHVSKLLAASFHTLAFAV